MNWLFGKDPNSIHAIVTIAADRESDLAVEIAHQRELAAQNGLAVIFEQDGATLPHESAGHEHFGFKDGISQPGVIGFDDADPDNPSQVNGKPGTELLPTGLFVLGYPATTDGAVSVAVPKWMWDGSFLVLRRLAQDVPGFWEGVETANSTLQPADRSDATGIPNADTLAARLVGRWRSGTPTDDSPTADHLLPSGPGLNDFDFTSDLDGQKTPHAAHIRKVYPRKGNSGLNELQTQARRILRRGIPFGEPFDPSSGRGEGIDAERGLIFQCYQASIFQQFLFLQQAWINNAAFPEPGAGNDALIGNASQVTVNPNGVARSLSLADFVTTQGAVYALTPSLSTLALLASSGALPVT